MSDPAKVVLTNLSKTFPNGVQAVCGIHLEIAEGEFIVLVGPSGCGKSTLLRLVAGLEVPTSGEIWIDAKPMNGVAASDRGIAMVFQNFALYPHLNAYGNIAFGLKRTGATAAEICQRVEEASRLLSLKPLLTRMPSELSGGERQRVALGRAIVRQPKVLLLDEPLSNLDARLRWQMRLELSDLQQRLGTTVIYVTHDQEEAMSLGHRLVVMDGGRVQQVGTPQEVYRRPMNQFVASFIGGPPMSFIAGRVDDGVFRPAGESSGDLGYVSQLAVGNVASGPALLGVRAEDFVVGRSELFLGRIKPRAMDHYGHESLAHFEWQGRPLFVRLPPDVTLLPEEVFEISVRPGAHALFSVADGRRLN